MRTGCRRVHSWTIVIILALAQLMNHSGMSHTLGLAFTLTGKRSCPVRAWPWADWGVFDRVGYIVQRALLRHAARDGRGRGPQPYLAVAANTTGGVTAKMISPSPIAVAVGATATAGRDVARRGYLAEPARAGHGLRAHSKVIWPAGLYVKVAHPAEPGARARPLWRQSRGRNAPWCF